MAMESTSALEQILTEVATWTLVKAAENIVTTDEVSSQEPLATTEWNGSSSNDVYEFSMARVSIYVLLVALGVPFNCLSLAFFIHRLKKQWRSHYVYMAVLAVCDVIFITFTSVLFICLDLGISVLWLSGCNIFVLGIYVPSHLSSFLVATISIERCVALYYPMKYKSLETSKIKVVGILVAEFVTIVLFNFFTFGGLKSADASAFLDFACIGKSEAITKYYFVVHPWIDSTLYSYMPALILVIANGLIIKKTIQNGKIDPQEHSQNDLTRADDKSKIEVADEEGPSTSKKMGHALKSKSTKNKTLDKHSRHLQRLCLLLSASFLILTSPVVISRVISVSEVGKTMSLDEKMILGSIVTYMSMLNHVINFIIYCVAIPSLRAQLKMWCCRCPWKKQQTLVVPDSMQSTPVDTLSGITASHNASTSLRISGNKSGDHM